MKKGFKQASMELSINTIVILVIAIAVLGLGLAFTKNMFGSLGSQLKIEPPEYHANPSEPIVLSTSTIDVNFGKELDIPISIYNVCGAEIVAATGTNNNIQITCDGLATTSIAVQSGGKLQLDAGTESIFRVIVKTTQGQGELPSKYACDIKVMKADGVNPACSQLKKSFVLNIQS